MGSVAAYFISEANRPQGAVAFSAYPTESADLTEDGSQPNEPKSAEEIVWIDLKGAVVKQGVYQLAAESRMIDAVQLAGGFAENAEQRVINLAERIQDGQMIYIPYVGESEAEFPARVITGAGSADRALISINRADEGQLTQLPGIGPARAAAIIAYREEHGPFKRKEDLMEISGIGQKTFEKLRDLVAVD
ncbi:hypothetical protein BEP19_06010 [Ammoniphilus oxalaticus]|uniref:Helix-hairpin-helix DNA-binding motif class 1 domain-containing protein n=2 Tax=Ammoniphilus oxalaticus TaxID=66863 RepID=A0A419SKX5_9BACL|nr:hypothetical protein BEP19_06010 [Ammoniphilus oxalaticus]